MKSRFLGAATLCLLFAIGAASAQTIDDIQYYNPLTGLPESPHDGSIVTVEGVIYVLKGTYNNGTHYIQGATGGINFYHPSAPALTYGDRIQVTGTVTSFGGEINIGTITNVTFMGHEAEPTPTELTIAALMGDYENVGNFVTCVGNVTTKGTNNFYLKTGTDSVQVYVDSDTGIDLGAVADGDEYRVTSPCVVYNGEIELKPRKQGDLIEDPFSDLVPVIENVNCDLWCPMSNEAVTVTATITDDVAVTGATLHYRNSDGSGTGGYTPVTMTNTVGDTYSGVIPAPHTNSQVDFYVEATDGVNDPATNPGDAPSGYYEFAVGFTSIYDMQYVHPDSSNQDTPYLGKVLNIKGVVTARTGEAGSDSKFVLQEYDREVDIPGYSGRFKGVLVYEGTAANFVFRGDLVKIGGYGNEYFGLTEMEPHNGTAVYIESFGNELPPPMYVDTRLLADDTVEDGNSNFGEAYESVWIRTEASAVIDTLGYGEYLISDTGARADSVEVDPMVALTYVPVIGDHVILEGFMDFDYGARQITPIADEFVVFGLTGVDETPGYEGLGKLQKAYPNPFNPMGKIAFRVNADDTPVQLNMYDMKGRFVRTLMNDRLPANEYTVTWDGKDASGRQVASGTYFARLRLGAEQPQVLKMTVLK